VAGSPSAANGWLSNALRDPKVRGDNLLSTEINVGSNDAEILTNAFNAHVTDKQFDSLECDGTQDDAKISAISVGKVLINKLFVPDGRRMVQVAMTVKDPAKGWDWAADPGAYTVIDDKGQAYKPQGVYASIDPGDGMKRLLAFYKAAAPLGKITKVDKTTPTDVTMIYLIPKDRKAVEYRFQGLPGGLPLEP
jgi:hypothetical protein